MNLDFSEEQKQLRDTVRAYLSDHAPMERARTVLESGTGIDRELWTVAGEMGWLGVTIPEAYGGCGFGSLELAVVAEELGRAISPVPVSSSIYLACEAILRGGSEEQQERYLPKLASGELIGTFALAEAGGVTAPATMQATLRDGRLYGTKVNVPDGLIADFATFVARDESGEVCVGIVDFDQPAVSRHALPVFDRTKPAATVEFSGASVDLMKPAAGGEDFVADLLDHGVLFTAFEQLGGAQACLEMARDYSLERFAFGRPIGSYQAMKHRMADMFVKTEIARSNCYYGAWAVSSAKEEMPIAACVARISASDAFEFCAQENLHVHGGVGCTWEYDCHLYLRRAKALEQSFGRSGGWKERLASRLLY
ncbi:acyl-CoA dehydrogenase family protein [Pseudohaliea sp.]|uniref:acyl-CoA dehydrogenase family protein n=1 Tax=Pseudohaliea sp. TaxID=2740289 RepID=UPI0032EFCC05